MFHNNLKITFLKALSFQVLFEVLYFQTIQIRTQTIIRSVQNQTHFRLYHFPYSGSYMGTPNSQKWAYHKLPCNKLYL